MSKVKKKKTAKQTYFNLLWLNEHEWLKQGDNRTLFGCKRCAKTDLKLGNMGLRAVVSHMKSRSHLKAEDVHKSVQNFFKKHKPSASPHSSSSQASEMSTLTSNSASASSSQVETTSTSNSTCSNSSLLAEVESSSSTAVSPIEIDLEAEKTQGGALQSTIEYGVYTSQVFTAEIIWCIRTVVKDNSNTSNEYISKTFRKMFPDSKIAANFTCGKDKTKYIVNHGISPWIKDQLSCDIEKATFVVIGFDESLNKATQTCQMDLNVRFWDPVEHKSKIRYWDSKFLRHTANTDILTSFNEATLQINSSKVLQVSMDGPYVNHLFYEKLVKHRAEIQIEQQMISIGSCGLHIIHGAFKFGFEKTSWKMKGILKGSFVILHDTPARRADFISVTKSDLFPLFFCATRWVEDKEPADRLYNIWGNMKQIVKFWRKLPTKKQPSGKSFDFVKDATEDVLTKAKLAFFSYVASLLEPFLTKYQTSKPMIPYLYTDMAKMYKCLYGIIVKDEVVDVLAYKLPRIDLSDKKNLKKENEFTLGFKAQRDIKDLLKKDDVTTEQLDEFYENVLLCVTSLIGKLNERCSLTSIVVRSAVVFNPMKIIQAQAKYLKKYLGFLLEHLVALKLIKENNCDKIDAQYQSLHAEMLTASIDLGEFPETRLDDFYYKKMMIHQKYPELSEVVSLVLTLSHGNADVERGYSLNKGVLKVHINEDSVVSKRRVKDYLLSHNLQPHMFEVSKELQKSCRQARSRYH